MEEENLPNDGADSAWAEAILQELPSVSVTPALQARLLASFDEVTARRHSGLGGLLRRLGEAVWPGAPAWQPAAVLAASLAIGIAAGTFVPLEEALADGMDQPAAVALDAPPTFDLGENS
jgi:hypothetical protein